MTAAIQRLALPRLSPVLSRLLALVGRHAIATSLVLLGVFAFVDRLTGVEATFVVLTYLVPIAIVAWFRSRIVALVIAAIATCSSSLIFSDSAPYVRESAVVLNGMATFGVLAVVIYTLHELRRHVDRERLQRRAAVEQLRHAERLNVIGTLAAGVAHELGTPLNVISGAAEMLGDDDLERGEASKLGGLILRQTDQITAIIRHLLDFGRRAGVASGDVNVDRTVASAAELLASTARKRDVEIVLSSELSDGQFVRANARELEQVISNVMLNGIQAMPNGGTLRVATRVERRGEGLYGAIVVEDKGPGISREDLPFIFDPFFTTKGVGEGTGLGLSVSYGIVKDSAGWIEVASAPRQGATFTVLIPLAETPPVVR